MVFKVNRPLPSLYSLPEKRDPGGFLIQPGLISFRLQAHLTTPLPQVFADIEPKGEEKVKEQGRTEG